MTPSEPDIEKSQRKVLAKAISYVDYIGIGLGTMVGIGWVIVVGEWLVKGGPLGAVLAFIICGILLTTVGKCYAELTTAIPVAGGELAFAYKSYGSGTSFITGWLLALAYITICPFETVSIGWLLEYILPGIKTSEFYSIGGSSISLSSVLPGVIIGSMIIFINYRGVKHTALVQTISTGLIFACACSFILVALIKGNFANMQPYFAGSGSFSDAAISIIAVLAMVPFFMAGFDAIPQAAEESGKNVNPRDLGKAIIISILAGALFYCLIIIAVSVCLPWQSVVSFEMSTAEVFRSAFEYDWAAKLVLLAAFFGLITCLNGAFLAGTRVLFSAGRGGLLPHWFGEVHDTYHTPKNSILFVGILSVIGPFIGKSILIPLVNVGSFAFAAAWFITCISAVKLRTTYPDLDRPYKVRYTITLWLGAVLSAIFMLLLIIPKSPGQLDWPGEYSVLGIWIFLGYIGYLRRKATKDMTPAERDYQILGDYR